MELLIDGYNLLHATDLFGTGASAGTLEGSREALLGFLSQTLTASERRRTTIVFDAAGAPPGLPATMTHEGITIHFARDYPDADSMIEALIEARPRGKGLMVISSDHRVQRAARSHGAQWCEAGDWRRDLLSRGRKTSPGAVEKRDPDVGDVGYWTDRFTDQATLDALEKDRRRTEAARPTDDTPPAGDPSPRRSPPKSKRPFGEGIFEGFPPGYADDLADELKEPPEDGRGEH